MAVEPLDKTQKVLSYLLTSNSAVPMAMEPSISMTTSEGESERHLRLRPLLGRDDGGPHGERRVVT